MATKKTGKVGLTSSPQIKGDTSTKAGRDQFIVTRNSAKQKRGSILKKKKKVGVHRYNVRFPQDVWDDLESLREETGMSINEICVAFIGEGIKAEREG